MRSQVSDLQQGKLHGSSVRSGTEDSGRVGAYTETTLESAAACETHTPQRISSLRKGIDSNCKFGTYRASATRTACLSLAPAKRATIRIDKKRALAFALACHN